LFFNIFPQANVNAPFKCSSSFVANKFHIKSVPEAFGEEINYQFFSSPIDRPTATRKKNSPTEKPTIIRNHQILLLCQQFSSLMAPHGGGRNCFRVDWSVGFYQP
jgi:hypothetical protein